MLDIYEKNYVKDVKHKEMIDEATRPMTDAEFRKLMRDMNSDLKSDIPDGDIGDIVHDVARNLYDSDKRIREYLKKKYNHKKDQYAIEFLADSIYSGR